jgi:3-oxoacyl-[acyl-carrier-protein] synthase II
MRRRVVITGMGAVSPLGDGVATLHDRWLAGETGIRDGEGRALDFDPTVALSAKEARRADRFTQMALVAGREAAEQAGWVDGLPYDAERVGCVVGTGIGGIGTIENEHDHLRDSGPKKVSPLSVPLLMGNAAPAALSLKYDLQGQMYSVVSACAAGAQAIGAATRMIQGGEADAVMTGGAEAAMTPLCFAAFASAGTLSKIGVSRPFDSRRDGFIMGEGAAVLVLEDREAALARGAEILGEVLGYGSTADAHHITAPEPAGRGAAKAIGLALRDADLQPGDIDYVNAHGTSTPLNDRAESVALTAALGERAREIPISSTKSAIGHLLGAAGAVEAVASVHALRERVAPPTLGFEERDPELEELDFVPGEGRALEPRGNGSGPRLVAMSNSFGFGGHNAVLILGVES